VILLITSPVLYHYWQHFAVRFIVICYNSLSIPASNHS
jgi:hypothetical protein